MSIKNLNPYLNFNGDAEKAIKLYEKALGARAENVMRWGDLPPGEGGDVKPEHKNRVMHALLHLGPAELMVADTPADQPAKHGDNSYVNLSFDDVADMKKKFDALAAGGQVTMPLQDTFWGAKFGMLKDAFGVQWMFNCQLEQPAGGNGGRQGANVSSSKR
jgi:PhnB protein